MAIRPDYVTGTITLTSGSTSFTTSGSALQAAAVKEGDEIITRSGNVLIIASITGQNAGTLMQPCPASAAGAAQPLRIRYQPDGSRYQGAARDLISRWGDSGNVDALAALVGAAGKLPIFTGPGTMDLVDKTDVGIEDPNGTLGELADLDDVDNLSELAKLVLAANKVLTTGDNGELTQSDITAAARVLLKLAGAATGNKLPYFNGADSAALTDFTAAARTLLNLTGSAAADRMPYFTGANEAGLTTLTAFARSILDDANGGDVWATLGASGNLSTNGWARLPNGLMLNWGSITITGGDIAATFPQAFPNAIFGVVIGSTQSTPNPSTTLYSSSADGLTLSSFAAHGRYAAGGGAVGLAPIRAFFIALGR